MNVNFIKFIWKMIKNRVIICSIWNKKVIHIFESGLNSVIGWFGGLNRKLNKKNYEIIEMKIIN